jgi:phage shock protein PspC (stress-responsive transcriptional regulator)
MATQHGLFRSRTDKVFGGVCSGIARSLNTDPFIVRLIFALLFIFGGTGVLLYIILWIALPEEPLPFYQGTETDPGTQPESAATQGTSAESQPFPEKKNNGALIVGLILIGIGIIFLADRFIPHVNFRDFWPVIIIIAGVVLIAGSFTKLKRS